MKTGSCEHKIENQTFLLLAEKAILWKEKNTILIADTHFGKVTHFRKSGISIPEEAASQNFENFKTLLNRYNPSEILILGDLFHSEMNSEWLYFKDIVNQYPSVKFKIIQGNHDVFHAESYKNTAFEFIEKPLRYGPFILSHEPLESKKLFNICGHIHPGVKMLGNAKQSLRLPCFFFQEKQLILPAFGKFTGLHTLRPNKKDMVFVIVDDQVISVR